MRFFCYSIIILITLFILTSDAVQIPVTATAYTHTGHRTSTGIFPRPGHIAISRDLERTLKFGDKVLLLGSVYTIQDRMAARWRKRVDIFMPSRQAARQFGVKHVTLTTLPTHF